MFVRAPLFFVEPMLNERMISLGFEATRIKRRVGGGESKEGS